ncbi:DHS-like NAD/FAD-binding domain-containing protein [Melanomma pulvis-pyrius CBS 109.77]|uniref:DHS-like NAD/FAD-binding domain-containing protein n=1 Tax=Melanomma pulvis-pyrius CBS 109.77 TaxID=1314802 RepID=A0A6A6WPL1_9PLEO|nr:DHS-like NAD/FAD-binding domain-containing protein [Melanomma pulvis-pyrius CBS 109.77]
MPPLLRVPYTDPLPSPRIIPTSAATASGAIAALVDFLTAHSHNGSAAVARERGDVGASNSTVLLTGAGISVASGLADYRGANGTYTLNRKYVPIYFNEFCASHEARKRYWARSFLGWTNLHKARPNAAHRAVGRLGELGIVGRVVTQNVDSFHAHAHPALPTTELHGYLRSLVCLSCANEYPRSTFQTQLSALNPAWAAFLAEMVATGALDTENPAERRAKGLVTNPDGDVDLPNAPYSTFRYPACPACVAAPPRAPDGRMARVDVDDDGAWAPGSTGGILKPAVVMFGESIPAATKTAAERAVDAASRILVVGSSLATYSAWRLVKRARENGMPIAILNMGGVRGEEAFFAHVPEGNTGRAAVRCSEDADKILPQVVKILADVKRERKGES